MRIVSSSTVFSPAVFLLASLFLAGCSTLPDPTETDDARLVRNKLLSEIESKAKVVRLSDGAQFSMQPLPTGIWAGRFEVSREVWIAVTGNDPSNHPSHEPNLPVVNVSFYDCLSFVKKLNSMPGAMASGLSFRLPTVKEWQYACRGGGDGDYGLRVDGTSAGMDRLGWYNGNSRTMYPLRSGQLDPNAYGLYDMHGNAEEWAVFLDGSGDYPRLCGGSIYSSARNCGIGSIYGERKSYRSRDVGFRLFADSRSNVK